VASNVPLPRSYEKGQGLVRGTAAATVNNGRRQAARGNQGPRRQLLPRRRHLQTEMGVEPLAGGYGGAGGLNMNQEIPDMQTQAIPDDSTMPPASGEPINATTPPSATSSQPFTTPPSISPVPSSTLPANATLSPSTLLPTLPSNENIIATFVPGLLSVMEGDLLLSQGLTSQIIATSGMPVQYADGAYSAINFHPWPDGAGIFVDSRPSNPSGWIYVSNSEHEQGGVGAITFNSQGQIIDYQMILTGTTYSKIEFGCVTPLYQSTTLNQLACLVFFCFPLLFACVCFDADE
jgi:hypothetical protein